MEISDRHLSTGFFAYRSVQRRVHRWPSAEDREAYRQILSGISRPSRRDAMVLATTLGHNLIVDTREAHVRIEDLGRLAEFFDHAEVAQAFWEMGYFRHLMHADDANRRGIPDDVPRAYAAALQGVDQTNPDRLLVGIFPNGAAYYPGRSDRDYYYVSHLRPLCAAALEYGAFLAILDTRDYTDRTLFYGAFPVCGEQRDFDERELFSLGNDVAAYANQAMRKHPATKNQRFIHQELPEGFRDAAMGPLFATYRPGPAVFP